MNSQVLAAVAIVAALLVILGILVKMLDLKRRREAEAVHVQAQISDALLREPSLFGMPVTPTAHVPLWSGTPVRLEITGHIPVPEARETVLRLVRAEAVRMRPDVWISRTGSPSILIWRAWPERARRLRRPNGRAVYTTAACGWSLP